MNIRVIRTNEDYKAALSQARELVVSDPELGTGEAEKLELLSILIADFESKTFFFDIPDPISAIEFRMEEQGLRQRDLIPILGSRSRVSEVLARKRPLTLPMIRSLSESLGIPTEVLVRPSATPSEVVSDEPDWKRFPFEEMQKRGWIPRKRSSSEDDAYLLVKEFLANASKTPATALFRRNLKGLGYSALEDSAKYSTYAWTARILNRAQIECTQKKKFHLNTISAEFLRRLSMMSAYRDGPRIAIQELKEMGICVIVEPRLPGSMIDGAALLTEDLQPVIALTLRFDRVDYFWFTLMHELAHVWKHLNTSMDGFVDRIDSEDGQEKLEREANRIARDALIPRALWNNSMARLDPTTSSITGFAAQIGVHPAIVAGRVRFESDRYNRFSGLLGQGTVRNLFPEVQFS